MESTHQKINMSVDKKIYSEFDQYCTLRCINKSAVISSQLITSTFGETAGNPRFTSISLGNNNNMVEVIEKGTSSCILHVNVRNDGNSRVSNLTSKYISNLDPKWDDSYFDLNPNESTVDHVLLTNFERNGSEGIIFTLRRENQRIDQWDCEIIVREGWRKKFVKIIEIVVKAIKYVRY
jgi:hypothetical protein